MTLKTRKPTGIVPWPLILIEGGEKVGKGWAAAVLSASPKVGKTAVIDLNEGAWDEYGKIPGARFEIAEHDGSWAALMDMAREAKGDAAAAREAGDPPFVLVIDGMTAEWDLLKDWAATRARTSASNRKKLAADPNAEVTIPMNIWNDVNARHRRLMTMLMTFPGIVIMTARGGYVAAVGENGQPVEGKKTYRVEGHKTLGFDASCWIRLARDERPVVVGARSVYAGVRPGIDRPKTLPDDWSLEWLVFEQLRCDPVKAHVRDLVVPKPDALTPEQIRDEALESTTTFERTGELHAEAKRLGYEDVTLMNGVGEDEALLAMLVRLGNERKPKAERPHLAAAPAAVADEPAQDVPQPESWYDDAIAKAADLQTDAAGVELFREAAAKARAGEITPGQATHIQNLVNTRIATRRKALAATILEPLAEDDPWRDKILNGLDSDEEARRELGDVEEFSALGQLDVDTARLLGRAIIARFPKAGVKELKPPARKPEAA